jgi:SOS response regulatory protein OraA/RecX
VIRNLDDKIRGGMRTGKSESKDYSKSTNAPAYAILSDGERPAPEAGTVLKLCRRKAGAANLLVVWDDGTAWKVPIAIALEKKLAKGMRLGAGERSALWDAAQRERALDMALRLISFKDRLSGEIERRLSQRGFSAAARAHAIGECRNRGLLDDEGIARRYASQRLAMPGKGERGVVADLAARGLSLREAKEIVEALAGEREQLDGAMKWLSRSGKKYADAISRGEANAKQKLAAALARRGYKYEIIDRVFARLSGRGEAVNADED